MEATALLLTIAFRHRIIEPNIDMGFETFVALSRPNRHGPARPGQGPTAGMTFDAFRDAVGACLRDGLIREPIRLPEGALQCHWHLELASKGVAAVRHMARRESTSGQSSHND
jgi:hypothetical protein